MYKSSIDDDFLVENTYGDTAKNINKEDLAVFVRFDKKNGKWYVSWSSLNDQSIAFEAIREIGKNILNSELNIRYNE